MSHPYDQFRNDVKHILCSKVEDELIEQICTLSWEVSFMPKETRIKNIQFYIKSRNLDRIVNNNQKIDTFELILALTHLRRAKYNDILGIG